MKLVYHTSANPGKNYNKYLDTFHWQNLKENFYKVNPKQCSLCRETKNIHLHHRRYANSHRNLLFHEKFNDLIALCGSCHSQWHAIYGHRYMKTIIEERIKNLIFVGFAIKAAMQLSTNGKLSRNIINNFKHKNGIKRTINLLTLDPNGRTYCLVR